jgi:hypothetical protein
MLRQLGGSPECSRGRNGSGWRYRHSGPECDTWLYDCTGWNGVHNVTRNGGHCHAAKPNINHAWLDNSERNHSRYNNARCDESKHHDAQHHDPQHHNAQHNNTGHN